MISLGLKSLMKMDTYGYGRMENGYFYLFDHKRCYNMHRILRKNDTWIVGEVYIFAKG